MGDMDLAKKAMVAAVNEALNYKEKNKCSDEEVLQHIVRSMNSIIARAR